MRGVSPLKHQVILGFSIQNWLELPSLFPGLWPLAHVRVIWLRLVSQRHLLAIVNGFCLRRQRCIFVHIISFASCVLLLVALQTAIKRLLGRLLQRVYRLGQRPAVLPAQKLALLRLFCF
jgi:hypothetical protein